MINRIRVTEFGNKEIIGYRKEGRRAFWLLEDGTEISSSDLRRNPINIECHRCGEGRTIEYYAGKNGLSNREYVCKKCLYTGSKNPFFGKTHSDETKIAISNTNAGKLGGQKNPMWGKSVWDLYSSIRAQSIKRKISNKSSGENNGFWGKTHTDEYKKRKSEQARQWMVDHPEHLQKMVAHSLEAQKKFRKTKIEVATGEELERRKIPHKYCKILHRKYQYDFLIGDRSLLEVNGDYWHANPLIYGPAKRPLNDIQKFKVEQDKLKKEFAEKYGYHMFYIWETDIKNRNFSALKGLEF